MSVHSGKFHKALALLTLAALLIGAVSVDAFAAEAPVPAEGLEPVEPEAPVAPEEPVMPEESVETEGPIVPEVPAETATPVVPEVPVETDAPVVPEAPAETEASAEPAATEAPAEEPAEEGLFTDDPLYWKYGYGGPATIASIPAAFADVKPRTLRGSEALRKGVDVSEYQVTNKTSYNIDWTKAAAAGIEFAFVRAGYRGTREGALAKDAFYDQNIKMAQAAGIQVGLYFFSQATTTEEAREEAQYLVSIAKNYRVDLPLVFDYEEVPSVESRRLKLEELDRQTKTDICNAFCREVGLAGYQSMVYTNLSMLSADLYADQLGRIWLAHWTEQTTYSGAYEYWQFGLGAVSGIPTTVDLDYWFDPYGSDAPPAAGGWVTGQTATPTPTVTPTPTATPKPTGTPKPTAYDDVKTGDWFYADVQWASARGVAGGVGNNKFSPQSTATRGQVITMIYRLQGQPKVTADAGFTDLRQEYYKNAVNWAYAQGVVSGTGKTTFTPEGNITREDLVTMLYRFKGSPAVSGDLDAFIDAGSIHTYAASSMAWAVKTGLIKGYTDNTVRPGASATRAEVCAMLRRFETL